MYALRLLLVYGSFLLAAIGPALFLHPGVVTVWMLVWMAMTFVFAIVTRDWH